MDPKHYVTIVINIQGESYSFTLTGFKLRPGQVENPLIGCVISEFSSDYEISDLIRRYLRKPVVVVITRTFVRRCD